jgi:parvulin-like peptidyl-prolyl isomerase
LFLGFAIAQGIGEPDIPSGAVAIVEDAPDDLGTITKDDFEHALLQAAASSGIKPIPKPGEEQYDGLKKAALGQLLDTIWIQGQAAEMGISVTAEEVAAELKTLKEQTFKTTKQYREYLKESHYDQADIDQQVKVRILSKKIQDQLKEEASEPSDSEIEDYYEAAKSSQYTPPERRDIRIVVNKDKAKVEEAKAELEKDNSPQSWEEVAKRDSSDTSTKSKGGEQTDLTEELVGEPLGAAAFAAQEGKLEGPIEEARGFVIFEVTGITPGEVQSLDEVKAQIETELSNRLAQEDFMEFLSDYESTWESRTFCAPEVAMERCANFKGNGHSSEANLACYEADPAEPAESCPAPVTSVKPALPGSVSPLEPKGTQRAQRPHPPGDESATEAAPEVPELIE